MTHQEQDFSDIRESVAKLCARFPGEYWRKLDRNMAYPKEFVQALIDAGYLSVLIPEEYGGSGLKLSAAAAIMEEIQLSGCNGGACHAQMYTMGVLLRHGSEAQRQKWLPRIASGELRLQAFGVTEPTSGTDTSSLKTFAKRDGDDYVVNGQKIWTSRAEYSDLMILLARTTPKEQAGKRTEGLSVFLVDMQEAKKSGGLTIRPIRTMMNHSTTEVFFDNLRVPAENLIGEEGKGFRYILSGMNAERILIASECVGDAKWFIDKASAYAKERSVFGRPIGQNQGIQFPIAKSYANMRAAELMVKEATRLYEAGQDCGAEANMAKMLAADASFEAANACIQTHGGFGFAEEYDIERKFRETRLYSVAPISTNLILSFLAEHVLGMPRSYSREIMLPLEGLTVIAVEQAVAAPFCTSRLADAGATVFKVERPEGDFARGYDAAAKGQSSYFVWLNRGKKSVVIDLATDEGRKTLETLIAGADVLVQNLKPGAMDRLGFTRERLRHDYPKLVICTISGYGDDGPYAERKAYDLLIQAESGLASITGGPETPARVGLSIVDIATGATAHAAILEALIGRAATGEGADIRISMFDVMADWLTVPLLNAENGNTPKRMGLAHTSIAPYGVFRSKDGRDILISIQSEREWKKLCAEVMLMPDLPDDPRFASMVSRVRNRKLTDDTVAGVFGTMTRDELLKRLNESDIAFAEVNTMDDLSVHPHLRRIAVDSPNGVVAYPAPASIVVGEQRRYGAVPAVGDSTSEISQGKKP